VRVWSGTRGRRARSPHRQTRRSLAALARIGVECRHLHAGARQSRRDTGPMVPSPMTAPLSPVPSHRSPVSPSTSCTPRGPRPGRARLARRMAGSETGNASARSMMAPSRYLRWRNALRNPWTSGGAFLQELELRRQLLRVGGEAGRALILFLLRFSEDAEIGRVQRGELPVHPALDLAARRGSLDKAPPRRRACWTDSAGCYSTPDDGLAVTKVGTLPLGLRRKYSSV